jgi:hypothetical protein
VLVLVLVWVVSVWVVPNASVMCWSAKAKSEVGGRRRARERGSASVLGRRLVMRRARSHGILDG